MASDDPLDNGIDGDDERKEDDDAEDEPRLKYQRLVGSVPSLLSNDAAASIAVAERMIALGAHDGTVHILDFQGNQGSWEASGRLTFADGHARAPHDLSKTS
ncbi:vacuolar protein sorting-associated protein 41 homolog isoform X2 [Musa acuminata AAA Group]|uniref:vacuolar protein sorting-associated protein 41 homolog isoform X2 n=1 Tax=Musa acuminata AAA Group TaxID=214697 RepID=UPI0031D1B862